jgi:hypothetical protein
MYCSEKIYILNTSLVSMLNMTDIKEIYTADHRTKITKTYEEVVGYEIKIGKCEKGYSIFIEYADVGRGFKEMFIPIEYAQEIADTIQKDHNTQTRW